MDPLDFLLLITHLCKEDEYIEIRTSEQTEWASDVSKGKQENWQSYWLSCKNIESDWEKLNEILVKKNSSTPPHNIYYSINPRTDKKDVIENVDGYCNIWVDKDEFDEAVKKLSQISQFAPPSLEIKSGRGMHVLYRLTKRVTNDVGELLCRSLANFFKSDSVHNRNRILRLPGFINAKFESRPLCEVSSVDEEIVYDPETLLELVKKWHPIETPKEIRQLSEPTITEFLSIDQLKLNERIKNLIIHGRQKDDKKYASRSEADFAVIIALLKIGCSADVIKEIFAKHKIGERTDEVGEKYLDRSIEKASQFVVEDEDNFTENPIIENDGKYFRKMTEGEKQLTTFAINPKYSLMFKGNETIVGDIIFNKEIIEKNTQFKKSSFDCKRSFLSILKQSELCFYGTDSDTQYLLNLIAGHGLNKYNGCNYIGFFEDKFVYMGGYITKDGIAPGDIDIYLRQGVSVEEKFKFVQSVNKDACDVLTKCMNLVVQLNEGRVIIPIVGWLCSCYLKYYINKANMAFPLLNVTGTMSAGKTKLMEALITFMGLPSTLWSAKQSHFARVRNFSSTNVLPIVVDEFKNDIGQTNLDDWKAILRSAYGGEIDVRGTKNLETIEFLLQSPVAILGETPITSEAALIERTIQVRIDPSWLATNIVDAAPAKQSFLDLDLSVLPYHFITYVLNHYTPNRCKDDVLSLVKTITDTTQLKSARMIQNTAIVVLGLRLLNEVSSYLGCKKNFYDLSEPEDNIIQILATQSEENIVQEGGDARTKVEFDGLLESLSHMVIAGFFGKEPPPFVYDSVDMKIYMQLEACVARVHEWRRRSGLNPRYTAGEYKREARDINLRGSYVTDISARHYICGHRVRCLEIDVRKVSQSLDVSGLVHDDYAPGTQERQDDIPF